jgi:hypothetical protein
MIRPIDFIFTLQTLDISLAKKLSPLQRQRRIQADGKRILAVEKNIHAFLVTLLDAQSRNRPAHDTQPPFAQNS